MNLKIRKRLKKPLINPIARTYLASVSIKEIVTLVMFELIIFKYFLTGRGGVLSIPYAESRNGLRIIL